MKELIQEIWSLFNNKYNDANQYEEHYSDLAMEVLSDVQSLIELHEMHDKYKWHDLRKNPDDLPKTNKLIIATDGYDYFCGKVFDRCAGKVIEMLLYHQNDYYTSNETYIEGSDLIAWKYIEPFEEVTE